MMQTSFKKIFTSVLFFGLLLFRAAADNTASILDTVWAKHSSDAEKWKTSAYGHWSFAQKQALLSIRNQDANGAQFAVRTLDLRPFIGQELEFSVEVKGTDLTVPRLPHLGLKFMLAYDDYGKMHYPAAGSDLSGTFDWKQLSFTIQVPQEIRKAELILGLQETTGTVQFRNLKIHPQKIETFHWPKTKAEAAKWKIPQDFNWMLDENNQMFLHVKNTTQGGGSLATFPINVAEYAGSLVSITCQIKADKVIKDRLGYLGIKMMLPHTVNNIGQWPSATDGLHGTFDYKTFSLNVMLPYETSCANICLGIQDSTGDVYFRNLEIRRVSAEESRSASFTLPENFRCEYSDAVKNEPPRRGVMTPDPQVFKRQDIYDLAKWGANLVRWQFISYQEGYPDKYRADLDASLTKLLDFAPDFKRCNIKVVFDMHSPPGGRYKTPAVLGTAGAQAELDGSACLRLFMEEYYNKLFIETWRYIAERLKDCDVVWAYDLLNEPTNGGQNVKYNYLQSQYDAARAIRAIDPERIIIVESDEWARIATVSYLKPLPLKNIYYQFHFYEPGHYTHQGAGALQFDPRKAVAYPIASENVDKAALRKIMQPAFDFRDKYGARMFVGEFSAIRWAPGAAEWLEDTIAILEELGCSWTYHAFREWEGWSVEHDEDINNKQPVSYDTKRKQLLLNAFKKNQIVK